MPQNTHRLLENTCSCRTQNLLHLDDIFLILIGFPLPRLQATENISTYVSKTDIKSFDFAVNRFFKIKLLKTNNVDIVKHSQDQFGFKLPSELIPNRTAKFIAKLQASDSV